jgi:hypothetical protein
MKGCAAGLHVCIQADIIQISRRSLHDEVASRLREMSVEGRIAPGGKLNGGARDIPLRAIGNAIVQYAASREVSPMLAARLRRETGGEVLFDDGSRGRYSTDASIYQIMPVGVFVPKNEGDIAAAIAIARDLRVPVLARGAGTSQCGQTTGAALVIDNSKYFCNVLEIDVAARTATVEPGLVLDCLNEQL